METLIINKRHELPLMKRVVWDIITVLLWLSFLYLWKPLLVVLYEIITLKESVESVSDWIFDNIHSVKFEHAIFLLIATPIILFLLSRLNRHKSSTEHLVYESKDYANHFHVNTEELEASKESQLVAVYHDEYGGITKLKNQITCPSKKDEHLLKK